MQDRFRFRVYYKPHNKVYNVICLNCYRQNEIIIEYKGSTAIVEWENCEIIQCTGIKDKNGKLIYEGDIVKDLTYSCDVRYLCAFIPIFGGLGLLRKQDLDDYNFCKENWESYGINEEVRRLDNRFKLANQGNKLKCFSMHELKMDNLEVIGNIYQDEELLNGNNP